jgi:hypothetical protein
MTSHRVIAGAGKVGVGIIGVAAAAACVLSILLLPAILGALVEGVVSTFGIVRTALVMIVASFTSWFLQMSLGSMVLAFIVATTISAVVGGIIGAFFGCLGATFVLQRLRDRLEA